MAKLSIVEPPSIFDLLNDPIYKAYLSLRPKLPQGLIWGNPWEVVALRRKPKPHKGKPPWVVALRPDYTSTIQTFKQLRDSGKFKDISIISRRKFFRPPANFNWDSQFKWCPRCRRPTLFKLHEADSHHGLRGLPPGISLAGKFRCFYCGVDRKFIMDNKHDWMR